VSRAAERAGEMCASPAGYVVLRSSLFSMHQLADPDDVVVNSARALSFLDDNRARGMLESTCNNPRRMNQVR
jgi:hypothetical protein